MATIVEMINPLTGLPEQVDKLDHTAQEIDDAVDLAPQLSNPNLLDNWYFGNPVDQRQGRVVVPNTTYYSDNQLTTSAGTTSAYVTAYRYATGTASGVNYASFKLEDSDTAPTYYAAPENVVRGYTGGGYGIDRWKATNSNTTVVISDGFINLSGKDAVPYIINTLEFPSLVLGKAVTLSVLLEDGTLKSSKSTLPSSLPSVNALYCNIQAVADLLGTSSYLAVRIKAQSGGSNNIVAAKLELGSQQTLAHQDENGVWVLNEIPDYGEQLARCQRYFQTFATESLRPTNALDFRPVMRATPALSTITVGGKTLYTASADL